MGKTTGSVRDVAKSVKLSAGHIDRLKRVCERLDVSVNSYIVQAIARTIVADEAQIAHADLPFTLGNQVSGILDNLADLASLEISSTSKPGKSEGSVKRSAPSD